MMEKRTHETWWDEKAGVGFMHPYNAARQPLFDLIKPKFHGNVVDVGAGACLLYPQIKDNITSYTMADFTEKFCDYGKELYPEIDTYHASILDLPFEDNHFDVSTALAVFRHLLPKDMPKAIKELMRVAKKTVIGWAITPHPSAAYVKNLDGFVDTIHSLEDVSKAIGKPFAIQKVTRFTVYDI
jgi:ubiquinone/menaquinone biosynthesis C-methylase UbiE